MGKIVINLDAVHVATQLQAAARVDKAVERLRRVFRFDADVTRSGDRHQAVVHIVLADQRPVHLADPVTVEHHFPARGVLHQLLRLPAAALADALLLAPAAHRHHLADVVIVLWQQDFALARHDAHQMVELLLDGAQIVEDVRMIELKIIEDQRARAVVNEFGTLVEEGAVILIRLDNEEWTFS